MIKKTESLILAFENTADAMAAESFLESNGFPGRLIPVPTEITSGCGLAWKAPPESEKELLAALSEEKLKFKAVKLKV